MHLLSQKMTGLLLFSPVLLLQSHQKITEHLVLALAVLRLCRIAKKGTQLVLTQSKATQAKDLQHPIILQIQGNLEFPQDAIVVQCLFNYRRGSLFLAAI